MIYFVKKRKQSKWLDTYDLCFKKKEEAAKAVA